MTCLTASVRSQLEFEQSWTVDSVNWAKQQYFISAIDAVMDFQFSNSTSSRVCFTSCEYDSNNIFGIHICKLIPGKKANNKLFPDLPVYISRVSWRCTRPWRRWSRTTASCPSCCPSPSTSTDTTPPSQEHLAVTTKLWRTYGKLLLWLL